MDPSNKPVESAGDWEAYADENTGVLYYFNTVTGITQWNRPDVFPASPTASTRSVDRPSLSQTSPTSQETLNDHLGPSSSMQTLPTSSAPPLPSRPAPALDMQLLVKHKQKTSSAADYGGAEFQKRTSVKLSGTYAYNPTATSSGLSTSTSTGTHKTSGSTEFKPRGSVKLAEPQWQDLDDTTVHEIDNGVPRKYAMMTRVLVCGVAIALLWCTTFSVSKGIATTFLQSPGSDVVITSWETVIAITKDEQAGHDLCARLQTDACAVWLNQTITRLETEDNSARSHNSEVALTLETLAASCDAKFSTTFSTTEEWQKASFFHTIDWLPNCTAEERQRLSEAFGSFSVDVKSSSFFLSKKYTTDTQAVIDDVNQQIEKRIDYDVSYVDNKTAALREKVDVINNVPAVYVPSVPKLVDLNGTIDAVLGCVGGTRTNGDCPQDSIVDGYQAAVTSLNNTANNVLQVAKANVVTATFYTNTVVNLAIAARSVLNEVTRFKDAIEDNVPGINLPAVIPDLSPIAIPISLDSVPGLADIPAVGDYFGQRVEPYKAQMKNAAGKVRDDVAKQMNDLANQLNLTTPDLPTILNDYRPPNVTFNTKKHDENTQSFLDDQSAVLGQTQTESTASQVNQTAQDVVNFLNNFDDSLAFSNVSFPWKLFGGELNMRPMINAFGDLVFFLLLADYTFRALRTIRLLVKYWSYSAVGLPVVDIRKGETDAEGDSGPVKAARVVSSSFCTIPVFLIIVGIMLGVVIQAYLPFYHDYQEGCVDTNHGTVLSNNSFSFSYNLAAFDGNRVIADSIKEYDVNRSNACGELGEKSKAELQTRTTQVTNAERSRSLADAELDTFLKCVAPSSFEKTDYFERNPDKQNPIITARSAVECKDPRFQTLKLQNSIFNCSLLLPCSPTCTGPNEYLLKQATFEASCRSESMMHAAMWQTLTAIMVYVCINLSRLFIVAAITRLFWRSLTPYGFTYLANCTRKGENLEGQIEKLPQSLHKDILKYEREAVLLLICAVMIHLPYILTLSNISNPVDDSNNLAYNN